jgi:hypothetical protein
MNVENQILAYLTLHFEASPKEMTDSIRVSKQIIHRILAKLINTGEIEKLGRAPKVYYRLKDKVKIKSAAVNEISDTEKTFLQENFNLFTETGNQLEGIEAFENWCNKQNLPLQKTITEYIKTREKYLAYFGKYNLINGTEKLVNTKAFSRVCIDEMYYGDFYAIERFGKTRIGNLIHFAKQAQQKTLMEKICFLLKDKLEALITSKNIDAVGYIPPTIKREVQIMNYLKNSFNLSAPHINLKKVSGVIPIPQKSLSKIEDRISNANASIIVDDKRTFNRVLLIDDAVGSGATINETACKIKYKKIATEVLGFAIVGSFKGFDVIQEV